MPLEPQSLALPLSDLTTFWPQLQGCPVGNGHSKPCAFTYLPGVMALGKVGLNPALKPASTVLL